VGRSFAEEVHDSKVIASKFQKIYEECFNRTSDLDFDVDALIRWFKYQERPETIIPAAERAKSNSAHVNGQASSHESTDEVAYLRERLRLKQEDYNRLRDRYLSTRAKVDTGSSMLRRLVKGVRRRMPI
ncbi:hypothetical protein KVG22_00005, partial [Nitratireductor sp. R6]